MTPPVPHRVGWLQALRRSLLWLVSAMLAAYVTAYVIALHSDGEFISVVFMGLGLAIGATGAVLDPLLRGAARLARAPAPIQWILISAAVALTSLECVWLFFKPPAIWTNGPGPSEVLRDFYGPVAGIALACGALVTLAEWALSLRRA